MCFYEPCMYPDPDPDSDPDPEPITEPTPVLNWDPAHVLHDPSHS